MLHSLGLNSLFNIITLKVYSFTDGILRSYFNENPDEDRFLFNCEALARSVRSNIVNILEMCNNNPGFAVGSLSSSQLERPDVVSQEDWEGLVNELETYVRGAQDSLRELGDQLINIRRHRPDHPEYQTIRSEYILLSDWLSTILGRTDNLPNGIWIFFSSVA